MMGWRRRRDSNPRYALSAYNGLANRRLQPLGHVSGRKLLIIHWPLGQCRNPATRARSENSATGRDTKRDTACSRWVPGPSRALSTGWLSEVWSYPTAVSVRLARSRRLRGGAAADSSGNHTGDAWLAFAGYARTGRPRPADASTWLGGPRRIFGQGQILPLQPTKHPNNSEVCLPQGRSRPVRSCGTKPALDRLHALRCRRAERSTVRFRPQVAALYRADRRPGRFA
jgi:hypothetical protein